MNKDSYKTQIIYAIDDLMRSNSVDQLLERSELVLERLSDLEFELARDMPDDDDYCDDDYCDDEGYIY